VVANLRDLDQTLRSKQLELESLMEHQRIEVYSSLHMSMILLFSSEFLKRFFIGLRQ
jgi:hypothetical protein